MRLLLSKRKYRGVFYFSLFLFRIMTYKRKVLKILIKPIDRKKIIRYYKSDKRNERFFYQY